MSCNVVSCHDVCAVERERERVGVEEIGVARYDGVSAFHAADNMV